MSLMIINHSTPDGQDKSGEAGTKTGYGQEAIETKG